MSLHWSQQGSYGSSWGSPAQQPVTSGEGYGWGTQGERRCIGWQIEADRLQIWPNVGQPPDAGTAESFAAMQRELAFSRLSRMRPFWMAKLGLWGGTLGDLAMRALVSALLEGHVNVDQLKLHKNRIGTAGAQALAQFIDRVEVPPMELHLSHNYLVPKAVKLLLEAAARNKHYPRKPAWNSSMAPAPLWLRVEQQHWPWPGFVRGPAKEDTPSPHNLQVAMEILQQAQGWMIEARIQAGLHCPDFPDDLPDTGPPMMTCMVLNKKAPCSNWKCSMSRWSHRRNEWAGTPVVHLPYLWIQASSYYNHELPPEASLHVRDPDWDTWVPECVNVANTSQPSPPWCVETAAPAPVTCDMGGGFSTAAGEPEITYWQSTSTNVQEQTYSAAPYAASPTEPMVSSVATPVQPTESSLDWWQGPVAPASIDGSHWAPAPGTFQSETGIAETAAGEPGGFPNGPELTPEWPEPQAHEKLQSAVAPAAAVEAGNAPPPPSKRKNKIPKGGAVEPALAPVVVPPAPVAMVAPVAAPLAAAPVAVAPLAAAPVAGAPVAAAPSDAAETSTAVAALPDDTVPASGGDLVEPVPQQAIESMSPVIEVPVDDPPINEGQPAPLDDATDIGPVQ